MAILRAGRVTALPITTRRTILSPSLVMSACLRNKALNDSGAFCHRRYASEASSSAHQQSNSKAALAFALGAALSGTLGYYLAAYSGNANNSRAVVELNTQYGSPEDFKKAIEELKAALPDEDAVSTDAEDLERHGVSGFTYHAGLRGATLFCAQMLTTLWARHLTFRGRVSHVDRGRGETRQNCGQVPHACSSVLGSQQSRGALHSSR